jgi:hypothetical protein
VGRVVLGVAAVLAAAATAAPAHGTPAAPGCAQPRLSAAYVASVRRVLRSGRDVWGEQLLHSRAGPTYRAVAGRLKPLMLAAARGDSGHHYLTGSGVYYLAFGRPTSGFGTSVLALHLADGSELIANRVDGPTLTLTVGARLERYGACLAHLSTPRLYGGYLPILETRYVDAGGVRYRQESFAARIPPTRSLVSFVRLSVDARSSARPVRVRFTPSVRRLQLAGRSLVRGGDTYLYLGAGGEYSGSAVTYVAPARRRATVYIGWFVNPHPSKPFALDAASYRTARRRVVDFWTGVLRGAATFQVPERRVDDAERSLLIQNAVLAWRYGGGNTYQELSSPEVGDVAQVMGEYGLPAVDEAILRTWFWRALSGPVNWAVGERLVASARYYRLFHDGPYLAAHTPALAADVEQLGRQLDANSHGLLLPERYSSDVGASVYGLHSQVAAWEGLREMASVWAETGRRDLAARARAVASRLGAGLRHVVRESERRLPDGSLFVPVRLLGGERPYTALTASRPGSYWNLVAPYALATGFFPPRSAEARGVLAYLRLHGSRVLGLVRAAGYSLYGRPRFPTSGSDDVYELNLARFLADNDQAAQLVLSLYGQLAAGMTAGTYVSGEGATIAPVRSEYYRKMFLPPNSGSNAAFLETLRLLLVHETRGAAGAPRGLELAFATPRAWLEPGKSIRVARAPTSFGLLSYSLRATRSSVRASLEVPAAPAPRTLELRLRLPAGERVTEVFLDGRRYRRFDRATGTIDLSGERGRVSLVARYVTKP